MRATPISRLSLRQQVYSSLFRMLLDGRWSEQARLNDSALAAELGVSRTPVREALIQLEAEGLLACDPNRGFFVPPLESENARDLYPILWSLEQLAVFLAAGSGQDIRKNLEQAQPRATAGSGPVAALRQDRAWHAALVESSGNKRLIEMTRRIEALTRRYASALLDDAELAERRAREHTQIAEALATDQPARAFALLKMHWRAEMEEVLRALEERGANRNTGSGGEKPSNSRRSRAATAG
ncbi:MAG TPA: GntR family transcriptional regulator [Candidatus Solibacter sp.]|nr:GntR family transcriptional regulator [Candidatus Solibacter sp.]